jgi:hypothetical protein
LSISDTATGSPQGVTLTGIGAAAFTLTSPTANSPGNPALIGATQTNFVIQALGPSSFNGAISLACSAGVTCAFNPATIYAGGATSTLTVSNLTTSLANPYIFTVTGTSGSQTYPLQLSLEFEDYTLTATPSIRTIAAGTVAPYQIILNPLYGINNQQIQLQCYLGKPPDATCTFSPNATPTIYSTGPTIVNLSIATVKYVQPTHAPPRFPNGKLPPLIVGLLSLAALASLALGNRRRTPTGWLGSGWLGVRLATLSLILALNLALAACRPNTLIVSGTTTGGYTVTISGTLVSNTNVVRTTTLALDVTSSPPG